MNIDSKIKDFEEIKRNAERDIRAYEYLKTIIERVKGDLESATRYYETTGYSTEQYVDRNGEKRWIRKTDSNEDRWTWNTIKESDITDFENYKPYYEPILEERFYTQEEMEQRYNYDEYLAIKTVLDWIEDL